MTEPGGESERFGWLKEKYRLWKARREEEGRKKAEGGTDGSSSNVPSGLTPGEGINEKPKVQTGASGGGTRNEPIPPK